jgi:hypothetical protein
MEGKTNYAIADICGRGGWRRWRKRRRKREVSTLSRLNN